MPNQILLPVLDEDYSPNKKGDESPMKLESFDSPKKQGDYSPSRMEEIDSPNKKVEEEAKAESPGKKSKLQLKRPAFLAKRAGQKPDKPAPKLAPLLTQT